MVLLCIPVSLFAQSRTVTGTIRDNNGTPIPNASIVIKGTDNGTVSLTDGSFSIAVPDATTVLVFSAVGMNAKEVPVGTETSLDVSLEAGNSDLSEVVVVGYGTKLRKDLTGNIATIKGDEVANTPVANFNQALQGRAAGVFIESNNGKVGEGIKVRIRGSGSISASNSPLYVVDGIPINSNALSGNALADINFNDIESFEILKDASAAAIYGSRAANGVVLITTRKGSLAKQSWA